MEEPENSRSHTAADAVSPQEISLQLERLKASPPFRTSRRCVLFLDYVVRLALSGTSESPKERTIGIDVFSRDPNYDTNQDPVVRGTASEIRKRLAQYYQMPGHGDEIRVELPPGSYLPDFHYPIGSHIPEKSEALEPGVAASIVPPPVAQTPVPAIPDSRVLTPLASRAARPASRQFTWVAFAAIVVAVVLCGWVVRNRAGGPRHTNLDWFWAPITGNPSPVLLCVGQPKVYNLVGRLADAARQGQGTYTADLREVIPNSDRYLALGDAICLADIASLLNSKGREFHIRGGGSTTFADLRENSVVLIGSFTNDWSMRLAGKLRYTFAQSPDGNLHYVADAQHPNDRSWALRDIWPEWKMPADYAIVSRVADPMTEKVIVMAAGITQYGTAAAGELLTHNDLLTRALANTPAGWENRNLQLVLKTNVIGGTAGPPEVLATYVQ